MTSRKKGLKLLIKPGIPKLNQDGEFSEESFIRTVLIMFQERETQGRTVATAEALWYATRKYACGQPLASNLQVYWMGCCSRRLHWGCMKR